MNWLCAIGLHDWEIEGLAADLIQRTCKRCGMNQRQYYEDTLLGRDRITWTTSKAGDSTLRCMLGFHDWDTKRGDIKTEVMDKEHKLHPIVVHNHGAPETRICRRCDKRQVSRVIHCGEGPEQSWEDVLPFEGIQEQFPGNVGFRSSESIKQKMETGEYVSEN